MTTRPRLCHGIRLFHLHSAVKIRPFSPGSLGGIHSQGILPVIPLELQGKKHQPFSRTQPFQFPCWWTPFLGDFIGCSFGISKNQASTISYDTAFQIFILNFRELKCGFHCRSECLPYVCTGQTGGLAVLIHRLRFSL